MKKIALLLAALLVFGLLAGCNAEEDKKTEPDFVVPGYMVNLYTGEGWTQAEESVYDLELTKDKVTLAVIAYAEADFVDMPAAEDLYQDCLDDFFAGMTNLKVKEKKTAYEAGGNQIISTLYSAKSGDTTRQHYCFMVSFDDDARSMAFVAFSASEKVMKNEKADFKAIVDKMDANGVAMSLEEQDALLEEEWNAADGEVTDGEGTEEEPTEEEETSETEGESSKAEEPQESEEEGNLPSAEQENPTEAVVPEETATGETAPEAAGEATTATE